MKSISIHKIDDKLMALIEKKAREKGLSLNKTIKLLLAEAVGLAPQSAKKNNSFEEFCGIWSEEEFEEFEQKTAEFREIDPSGNSICFS